MIKLNRLSGLITLILLGSLSACNFSTNSPVPKPESTNHQLSSNLVALFLVKKDNIKNEFRGEVYPLALYIDGQYVDASNDVTPQIHNNYEASRIVQTNQSKSLLSAVRTFTAVDGAQLLGQFKVDQLGISQFACSSLLVGQGQLTSERSLPALYDALPKEHAGGFSGSIGNRQLDESWRWAIAASHYNPLPAAQLPANLDEAKVKQDLLALGEPLLTQVPKAATEATVVETVSVFDLDHDGQPEVLGKLRKGVDQSVPPDRVKQSDGITVYANVWLSYKNQPTVIASEVTPYEYPVTRTPYTVAGTLDINGDGTEEVIVKNNGYEATDFSIYQFNGTELKEVFKGAGYGC
ncbi:MAG TPA: hypothetical protein V6C57_15865 [Coleofasciculaceae cyanobacterium]